MDMCTANIAHVMQSGNLYIISITGNTWSPIVDSVLNPNAVLMLHKNS
jgi:hypothetical protein